MTGGLRHKVLAVLLGVHAWSAVPARAEEALGPFALTDFAARLVEVYNAGNVSGLHAVLAPALQASYPPEKLREALTRCRVLTRDILRLSTPSWGARTYGFFAAYAEPGVFEMILEIDPQARIVYLLITDDIDAKAQQCRLSDRAQDGMTRSP
ncbi:hypothetical protein [Salinarimonas soli]|uniref:DUF3887 domain-containing protein n=1 Tax=Salinarimonas soli TaxID=1638099 RepID=A0A5B2VGA0_9HYPH|nr:hypothetical protein [Salinarimonas soli]KAA2237412.1 hypothetical protein F0L46_10460 [Salinarimonas soli]